MAEDKEMKLATFIEITGSDDVVALQMLESTNWKTDEAVQLFFASAPELGSDPGDVGDNSPSVDFIPKPLPHSFPPTLPAQRIPDHALLDAPAHAPDQASRGGMGRLSGVGLEEKVRSPLPVKREALYGGPAFLFGGRAGAAAGEADTSRLSLAWAAAGASQRDNLIPAPPENASSAQSNPILLPPSPFSAPQAGPPPVDAFRDYAQEAADRAAARGPEGAAELENGDSRGAGQNNLANMYRPPFDLLFSGAFEEAKAHASAQKRWLLVNLQSNAEFNSHRMNRDTWADEMVKNIVKGNFVLWQVDSSTIEGRKICTYYHLHRAPVTLVLDPRTGQKQKSWEGFCEPQQLLEDLMPFIDDPPGGLRSGVPPPLKKQKDKERQQEAESAVAQPGAVLSSPNAESGVDEEEEQLRLALAASLEEHPAVEDQGGGAAADLIAPQAPPSPPQERQANGLPAGAEEESRGAEDEGQGEVELPEEPPEGAPDSCSVAVRCPDGKRITRRFLLSNPAQVLQAFCHAHIPDAKARRFQLLPLIPGSSPVDFTSPLSLNDSGLANSLLAFKWL